MKNKKDLLAIVGLLILATIFSFSYLNFNPKTALSQTSSSDKYTKFYTENLGFKFLAPVLAPTPGPNSPPNQVVTKEYVDEQIVKPSGGIWVESGETWAWQYVNPTYFYYTNYENSAYVDDWNNGYTRLSFCDKDDKKEDCKDLAESLDFYLSIYRTSGYAQVYYFLPGSIKFRTKSTDINAPVYNTSLGSPNFGWAYCDKFYDSNARKYKCRWYFTPHEAGIFSIPKPNDFTGISSGRNLACDKNPISFDCTSSYYYVSSEEGPLNQPNISENLAIDRGPDNTVMEQTRSGRNEFITYIQLKPYFKVFTGQQKIDEAYVYSYSCYAWPSDCGLNDSNSKPLPCDNGEARGCSDIVPARIGDTTYIDTSQYNNKTPYDFVRSCHRCWVFGTCCDKETRVYRYAKDLQYGGWGRYWIERVGNTPIRYAVEAYDLNDSVILDNSIISQICGMPWGCHVRYQTFPTDGNLDEGEMLGKGLDEFMLFYNPQNQTWLQGCVRAGYWAAPGGKDMDGANSYIWNTGTALFGDGEIINKQDAGDSIPGFNLWRKSSDRRVIITISP